VDDLAALAAQVEADAVASGIRMDDRRFNVEAFQASINAQYGNIAASWDTRVTQSLAETVLQRLNAGLYMADPTQAAAGTAADIKTAISRP
jgi:hypothetical protein